MKVFSKIVTIGVPVVAVSILFIHFYMMFLVSPTEMVSLTEMFPLFVIALSAVFSPLATIYIGLFFLVPLAEKLENYIESKKKIKDNGR